MYVPVCKLLACVATVDLKAGSGCSIDFRTKPSRAIHHSTLLMNVYMETQSHTSTYIDTYALVCLSVRTRQNVCIHSTQVWIFETLDLPALGSERTPEDRSMSSLLILLPESALTGL